MSCPYCENKEGNTFDWNEFGQFLIKCGACGIVFRPSKIEKHKGAEMSESEKPVRGGGIH